MRLRYLLGALCAAFSLCATAAIPASEQVVAVEFYNSSADHYFISAEPKEINDLDTGVHPGWARTGYQFSVIKAGSTYPGTVPMCRFFSESLNSHFYTAKAQECQDVKDKFAGTWLFESGEVYRAFPVDAQTGACAPDTTPTYRLYNNRPDANHRYTDQISAFVFMKSKNYIPEGDGSPALPVVFCTPAGGDLVPAASQSAPNCTATASSGNPAIGSTLALNASCTNNPTSYMWAGCTSSTASCNATSSTAGTASYTVYSANAQGPGVPVTVTVTWGTAGGGGGGGGGALPICTLSSSTNAPSNGSPLTLTANCSQTPASYEWSECNYLVQSICNVIPTCSTTSKTCTVNSSIPGYARYSVAGKNSAGTGPRSPLDVYWGASSSGGGGGGGGTPPPPAGGGTPDPIPSCSALASNMNPQIGTNIVLSASCSGNPTSFSWQGVSCSQIQCQAQSSTPGTVTYSVTASNASGSSVAYVAVNWGTGTVPNPVPSCSLSASNSSPQVGTSVTITASCTDNPTTFTWTNCTSTTSSCTDAASVAGAKTYSLTATNANGNSTPASVTVNWVAPATSPPVCTVSSSNSQPTVGSNITLTASCTNGPTSYEWAGCTGTGATCTTTASATGAVTYYVSGINQFGKGPPAGVVVAWTAAGGGGGGGGGGGSFCGQYANVKNISIPWGDTKRYKTTEYGSFGADTVIVVSITVPGAPASYGTPGNMAWAEYNGPPTLRHLTLSKSACDFRDPDPSGNNGPFAAEAGTAPFIGWNVGAPPASLVPGQTYYFNIRNLNCGGACEASTSVNWPH